MKLKKIALSGALLGLTLSSYAQETNMQSAMPLNENDLNGTARFRAMSGAFGAVGGDLSALKINPAGGAIFNYNNAAFSMSFVNKSNKANYNGTNDKKNYDGLDLGQLGAIFVFNSFKSDAVMKKFSIGVNYESTNNMRNNVRFRGIGDENSLGDYFLQIANHGGPNGGPIPLGDISPENQQTTITDGYLRANYYGGLTGRNAFLGYNGGLFTENNNAEGYHHDFLTDTPFHQSRSISTSGSTGLFSGNFAAQLGDRFYVGANLNIHTVDYTVDSASYQTARNSSNGKDENISFMNSTYTYGTGFSFNIGAIAQITEGLRGGLSYQSPTWYSLKDELYQGLRTQMSYDNNTNFIYPDVVLKTPTYKLKTPSKYTASLAYIFQEKGLISVDYSLKDYSNNKYKPTNEYQDINQDFNNELQVASELRIGAEYKIKQVSLRGGYRFEQSPYKNTKYVGDLNSFSLGLGYNFGPSRLDLSYNHTARNYQTTLVDMSYNNLYSNATVKSKENWINLTYSITF
ncbi:outer membrane protein transport protein [Myroides albus]|uniref:Hydrocarbon degradation protein n=1 Tax=Myroides albus TaxID=2562892 RepID=A0A6I3LC03_9FLAO|nr:outer membrane protein transport protein [Myroides albus]MTG96989.1 hydrocarbon degradation protein [Myroides albus]UVD80520.1 outer membrane protein transport protein [Myroides albus]